MNLRKYWSAAPALLLVLLPTALAAQPAPGFSEDRLRAMEAAIRAGTFPKVTSVLFARNGKLAYEKYFDGSDAATLRVRESTRPHTRIDEKTEYGYLWWLKTFVPSDKTSAAYYMTGSGGNKIAVFPELGLVAVITATNYNTKGMHESTDRLLTEYVLPAARR